MVLNAKLGMPLHACANCLVGVGLDATVSSANHLEDEEQLY